MINAPLVCLLKMLRSVVYALTILLVMVNASPASMLLIVFSAVTVGHLATISHPTIHAVFANSHHNKLVTQ